MHYLLVYILECLIIRRTYFFGTKFERKNLFPVNVMKINISTAKIKIKISSILITLNKENLLNLTNMVNDHGLILHRERKY